MNTLIESERAFCNYCETRQIAVARIRERNGKDGKKPDFRISDMRRRSQIVVEVKELTPNPDERDSISNRRSSDTASLWTSVEDRIRNKGIEESRGQFRNYCRKGLPNLLIVFDGTTFQTIDLDDVRQAMLGDEVILLCPDVLERSQLQRGHGRACRPDKNRHLSAIGLLRRNKDMFLFHNPFAEIPFPKGFFGCKEFEATIPANGWANWSVVESEKV